MKLSIRGPAPLTSCIMHRDQFANLHDSRDVASLDASCSARRRDGRLPRLLPTTIFPSLPFPGRHAGSSPPPESSSFQECSVYLDSERNFTLKADRSPSGTDLLLLSHFLLLTSTMERAEISCRC